MSDETFLRIFSFCLHAELIKATLHTLKAEGLINALEAKPSHRFSFNFSVYPSLAAMSCVTFDTTAATSLIFGPWVGGAWQGWRIDVTPANPVGPSKTFSSVLH